MIITIVLQEAAFTDIFSRIFYSTPINIVQGDLLEISCDTIVSPANGHGFLDGGIDYQYRNRFGLRLETELLEAIYRIGGVLQIGTAITIKTPWDKKIKRIIFAPTMEMPEAIPAVNVYRAMKAALRESLRINPGVDNLYFPALGCGVGMVEPESAAIEMLNAWNNFNNSPAV